MCSKQYSGFTESLARESIWGGGEREVRLEQESACFLHGHSEILHGSQLLCSVYSQYTFTILRSYCRTEQLEQWNLNE